MTGHNADLFIAGHRHIFALAQEQDEYSGKVAWLARARRKIRDAGKVKARERIAVLTALNLAYQRAEAAHAPAPAPAPVSAGEAAALEFVASEQEDEE